MKAAGGLLALVFAGAALAIAGGGSRTVAAQDLVISHWGGAPGEAIRNAWIKPFAEKSGIRVTEDTGPEQVRIKAMIVANAVTWDVVAGGGGRLIQGIREGLYEPIPAKAVNQDHLYPEARYEYGVPSEIFSEVLAFSTQAFPDGKPQPKTWADFWDVGKFPGKRSVYNRPWTNLEAALIADGVAARDVNKVLRTPEGIDRAFAKFEELKPHVGQWWSSAAQPVQALGAGDVVIAKGPNWRFEAGLAQGLPIRVSWDGAIAQVGYLMVVKGARNKENAFRFLNYMVSPEAQAELHKHIAYGPVTEKAWAHIPKDQWAHLPTAAQNLERSMFVDIRWWAQNEARLLERWQAFIQK